MDLTGFSWGVETPFIVVGAVTAMITVEKLNVIGTLIVFAVVALVYPGYIAWG